MRAEAAPIPREAPVTMTRFPRIPSSGAIGRIAWRNRDISFRDRRL